MFVISLEVQNFLNNISSKKDKIESSVNIINNIRSIIKPCDTSNIIGEMSER